MKSLLRLCVAVAALAVADVALADGNVSCPAASKAERRPPGELTAMLKKKGWAIRKMQMFNGCYEIYGFTKDGKKVEIYFNPVDGSIVKKEVG